MAYFAVSVVSWFYWTRTYATEGSSKSNDESSNKSHNNNNNNNNNSNITRLPGLVGLAALQAFCWQPALWQGVLHHYPGDSFHTLSALSATGLAILTLCLSACLLGISFRLTQSLQSFFFRIHKPTAPRHKRLIVAICSALLNLIILLCIFWILLTLVAQIYYTYYQLIFSGLPPQWVIEPIAASALWDMMLFRSADSLAAHSTAWLLWTLLITTSMQWLVAIHKRILPIPFWLIAAALVLAASRITA